MPEGAELRVRLALERIAGVTAARVELHGKGDRLGRALLAVRPDAPEGDVRAIAVAVLAALGVRASAEDLRMVVVRDGEEAPDPILPPADAAPPVTGGSTPPAPGPRILLRHDLRVHRKGGEVTCRVELAHGGDVRAGEAADLDTPAGRARAAARATLRAAQGIRPDRLMELEGILFTELFGRRQLCVSVEGVAGREHTFLTGLAPADTSPEESACHATLRAIERWLSR